MLGIKQEDNRILVTLDQAAYGWIDCYRNSYHQTHQLISPWTAQDTVFFEELPAQVYY